MGKKSRRIKNKGNTAKSHSRMNADAEGNDIASNMRKKNKEYLRETAAQTFADMEQMDRMSLSDQKKSIRETLLQIGTDCAKNDGDPFGDGDQSPIQSDAKADAARQLYSIGGDIDSHLRQNAISNFAHSVLLRGPIPVRDEIVKHVKHSIAIGQPPSRNEKIRELLERRETSMRLSPLLLIVSIGKNLSIKGDRNAMKHIYVEVAKILLKYGASPDAKDVLGKTVCHYGAGGFATQMTLEVTDMCIRAAQTSYMYGKEVELCGLKNAIMNGQRGIVCGFDADIDRRSVFLTNGELGKARMVSIKPENIKLLEIQTESSRAKGIPMLADVQDRLGSVSIHEVVIKDRTDVAGFLLNKHRASIYIKDMHGCSPMSLSIGPTRMASNVCKMVMDTARREGSDSRKAKKQNGICTYCKKLLGDGGKKCSGCSDVAYCGRVCQRKHWCEGHNKTCTRLTYGVKVKPLALGSGMTLAATSYATAKCYTSGSYRKPDGVKANEKFVMKVQAFVDARPILLYDETRTCQFTIGPKSPGFEEILLETRKEVAWNGRKTFMKASFDDLGDCTIYPITAGVKAKYTW